MACSTEVLQLSSNRRALLLVFLLSLLSFTLPLSATGTFTISAFPPALTVAQGGLGTVTITTTISGGFNSSISLSASGMPLGVAVSFNPQVIPAPGAGNSTMAITVLQVAKQGTYPITVTGNGGGIQQNTTVTLTVIGSQNFAISASPATLTISPGTKGTSIITTTIFGGFNSSISLSASGMPMGVAVSFNPQIIPAPGAGNSTMTITVLPTASQGTYFFTVTGSGGGLQRSVQIQLTVGTMLGFVIGAAPSSLAIGEGNQGTATITTFALSGFNYSISLTASGAPHGATVSLNPSTIPAPGSGSSTMTVTVASNTPTGIYPISVTGAGGGVRRSATVTLAVTGGPPPITANFMEPYSYALQSSFGQPPYTYQLISGSMPSGLTMNSSGNITGSASVIGQFPFQVQATDSSQPPQRQTSNYTLNVIVGLDKYGGLTAAPVPGCTATGYFQVMKVKTGNNSVHWVYADPLCNAFYQLSIYEASSGFILGGILQSHYGNDPTKWATHALQRELAYGFNSNDIFYEDYVLPIPKGANGSGASIKMPFQLFFAADQHAMYNPGEVGLAEAIKNLIAGQDNYGYQNIWHIANMDVMDPNWPVANQGELSLLLNGSNGGFEDGFNNTPWVAAISLGDADEFVLFKGDGAGSYAHPSQVVATSAFNYNLPPVNGNWQRPILYSKAAWTCNAIAGDSQHFPPGQSFLEKKYGNIAALNASWGSNYTSFCDAGGFGTGTGVLDEDGRHTAWFGNDYFNQTGMNANLKADLDQYLRIMAMQLYPPQISVVRGYDTNHLLMCGFYGGVGDFGMRPIVAQALLDSGCQVLVLQWNSEYISQALADNQAVYDITGLPITVYQQSTAQLDSDESNYPHNGGAYADYPTQLQRGQHYGIDLQNIYGGRGTNGDYYSVGLDLWSLTDNSAENANWGFISLSDNVYDGVCATRAYSMDPFGYACGGEAANYGDFTDSIIQANSGALQQLIQALRK